MTKYQAMSAVQTLLTEKIFAFCQAFIEASRTMFIDVDGKLVHPGEFGVYREAVAREFIRTFVPKRLEIESGFVISSDGKISSQCDLIIYDSSVAPLLQNENRQRFFPIETVVAVGEIKSVMSEGDLYRALRKLAAIKSIRDGMSGPSYVYSRKTGKGADRFRPAHHELDQIVTFLICEKFDFSLGDEQLKRIASCYNSEAPRQPANLRHNLILSICDGLMTYVLPEGHPATSLDLPITYPFPIRDLPTPDAEGARRLDNCFVGPALEAPEHIKSFASLLHTAVTAVSSFFPDMARYVKSEGDSVRARFPSPL
ncbi:DUF6602 domain-containing protein [Rhizobium paranaense]|uniref:DUF6602 domain-containing protein n=1 Tax=Rhizobium paranaense TaxID=1650438 RepID=A0A7W8XWS4_9HYPH|nr:DUF6602 domain-containing protein [Rhizobium paranaense]MBB5577019.1 hypothetical protein [Rhizobium paranaense]